jgi:hypothetical protein
MTKLTLERPTAEHIQLVADRMRQADRDEVEAGSDRTPHGALVYSVENSTGAWTALFDGVPAAIFGVGDINILTRVGAPWMLGTDDLERNFRPFLRTSISFRDQLLQRYSILRNFVDVRNTVSIRWLEWLGFTFLDPITVRGHEFRLFELRSDNV